jgi:hypothetical protein
MENLLELDGKKYYLDLNEIVDYVALNPDEYDFPELDEEGYNWPPNLIHPSKYDIVKSLLDVFFGTGFPMTIHNHDDLDETERIIRKMDTTPTNTLNELPIPFKFAFNTLIKNKFIKEYDTNATNGKNKRSNSKA